MTDDAGAPPDGPFATDGSGDGSSGSTEVWAGDDPDDAPGGDREGTVPGRYRHLPTAPSGRDRPPV
jgi:hypothetical protein